MLSPRNEKGFPINRESGGAEGFVLATATEKLGFSY